MNQKFRGRSLGFALCSAVTFSLAFSQHSYGSSVGGDSFTYPNGPLVGAAGSTWATHSGTTGQIQVAGGEITLVQTTNSEDANLPLTAALAAGGKYYAAFDLRVPTPAGAVSNVYFAHHQQGPSTFRARIWFLTGAPAGFYRVGISDTGTAPATVGTDIWSTDIAYGTTIRVVSSYAFDTGATELWLNPVNEASTKLTVAGTASTPIAAYGLREASNSGTSQQVIDNLCVGTLFEDVVVCGGGGPATGACCPDAGGPLGAGCACLGNMNGDGVVDFADVALFVNALLNNTLDDCADMNSSGADNGADVQAFVTAVLAETPCGIDTCTVLTEAECLDLGGTYLGDDTDCTGDPCTPQNVGACCTTTGCVSGQTAAECASVEGFYFGDGSTCAGQTCLTDNSVVVINEVRLDQPSSDNDEYFELAGPAGTLLNGLTMIVIGDSSSSAGTVPGDQSGFIERVISLNGRIIPADGRFLAGTAAFTLNGATPDYTFQVGIDAFENSDNLSFILVSNFSGSAGDLIDDDRNGTPNAVLPWAAIRDWVSVKEVDNANLANNDEWNYDFSPASGATVGPDGLFAPGHVYRNNTATNTDGAGTPWQVGPFDPAVGDDTPGVPNVISGACCVDGTTCSVGTRTACDTAGGVYKGTGTNCTVNVCVGACCANQTCSLQTSTNCSAIGGIYSGDGVQCTPNPCLAGCVDIASARLLPDEDAVRVCGVISSSVDTISGGTLGSFQIQDDSGADGQSAITIFGATGAGGIITDILTQASEGQEIELLGSIEIFNGLTEVDSGTTALQLISVGAVVGVPAPLTITAVDFQDAAPNAENLESEIVRIECVTFTAGNGTAQFAGPANYTVTTELGNFVARLPTDGTTLQGAFIPVGPVNVSGIFSQFDSSPPFNGGYQLLLRKFEDVETNPPNCTVATGGCCVENVCTVQTAADCATNAGQYLGNDTTCTGGCPTSEGGCLIISEVVDGDITGGVPKWIEITNTGTAPYLWPAGGIILQSNADIDVNVDFVLTGTTIAAGDSLTVSASASASSFTTIYGFAPDLQHASAINGNGNDRYAITDTADGSNILDVYGELGVDGTGSAWAYTDSVAVRNASASSGNAGVFNVAEWTITSVNGANDAESTTLLQANTTPGTHTFDPCTGGGAGCVDPIDTRTLTKCNDGGPSCAGGQTYCSFIVDANSPNIPAECGGCASLNGSIVCVPCIGSCPNGNVDMFKWTNFDGNGNDCYFEGTVFTAGGCLASGACFPSSAAEFSEAP